MIKSKIYPVLVTMGIIALGAGACAPLTPAHGASLEDNKWVLESYGDADNLKGLIADTTITAEFDSTEGTLSGSAGCNSYVGGYKLNGDKISISEGIAATEMYCIKPDGVMDQERDYLDLLSEIESYELEGNELTIVCGDQVLVFSIE